VTSLAGTGVLIRLVLRRDRVRLPVWLVGIGGRLLVSSATIRGVYPTRRDLETYAELVRGSAAMIVQSGPGHGLDDPTLGAVLVNETAVWATIAVALMSVFLVARHTRAEEESNRAELVRSAPVGRHAPTAAAVGVAAAANLVLGATIAVGLVVLGHPVAGSAAFGAAVAATGLTFTGLALLAAQVSGTARGVLAIGVGALAVAFALRAAGDVGDGRLSWLSPIGWAHAVRPFAGERWVVLGLPLATTTLLVAAAVAVVARRDLGAGLIGERPGPATMTRWSSSAPGLVLRLQRGSLLGWSVGLLTLGVFYGVVGDQADDLLSDSPEMQEFFAQFGGAALVDAFLATSLLLLSLIGSGFAVASALRPRGEEVAGRAEPVLTTGTSRWAWAASHLAVAVGGTVVVLGAGGLGVGMGYAVAVADPGEVPRLVAAALVNVPAALVLVGVATALFGAAPRAAPLAWLALAVAVVAGVLAELLRLPQWARNLSPFEHVPALPALPMAWGPVVVLTGVAAGLALVGLVGFRRRDVG
jgi:ABC-2 type transport system permease protein